MSKQKRITVALLAICFLVSVCFLTGSVKTTARAQETCNVVAIGDMTASDLCLENGYISSYVEGLGANANLYAYHKQGMRTEELRVLLDGNYAGDNYTTAKFPTIAGDRGEIATQISTADQVILSVGTANFGSATVSSLLGAIYDKYGVTLGDTTDYGFEVEPILTTQVTRDLYDTIFATVEDLLAEGGKLSDIPLVELFGAENVKNVINTYAYGFFGYIANYLVAIDNIRALNPDAEIVVVGLYNVLDGLKFELGGKILDVGTIGGLLIDGANMMLALKINNKEGVYFAYPGKVDLMLKDIASTQGALNSELEALIVDQIEGLSLDSTTTKSAFINATKLCASNQAIAMQGVIDLFESPNGKKTIAQVFADNISALETDAMQDLLALNLRMVLGGGVGVHLSQEGANKVSAKIAQAIATKYDGGAYLTEAVQTLNNDFESYALSILKTGILDYVDGITDNVYLKRLAQILTNATDFDTAHHELMESAQKGSYTVSESSYFLALGDAQGRNQTASNGTIVYSATDLLAKQIFGAESTGRYTNLSKNNMRMEDLWYLLDVTSNPDDYFYSRFNLITDGDKYYREIQKADVISLSFGGEGIYQMLNEQIGRSMNGSATLNVNWKQFVTAEMAEKVESIISMLKRIMTLPEQIDLGALSNNMIKGTINVDLLFDTVLHAYLGHLTSYAKVVELIHQINPTAKIIAFGYFNPMQGLIHSSETMDMPMGEFIDMLIKLSSMHALTFSATVGDFVTYVDLIGELTSKLNEEWIPDDKNPQPSLMSYLSNLIINNGADLLATQSGQNAIKAKAQSSITVTCAHIYSNECDTSCNACGEERVAKPHSYDNACDTSCNVCHEERQVGDHVYVNCASQTCSICGGGIRVSTSCKYDNACDTNCNVCGYVRSVPGHLYDHACDVDCNICGLTRTPADHKYDHACDGICNVCGTTREVPAHVYDHACDAYCNVCQAPRTPANHVYDNDCSDTTCNVCGAFRQYADHVYDNACDASCNNCAHVRQTNGHVYDNACDHLCNVCGEQRSVPDHVYDNKCDATCNECGSTRYVGAHVYDDKKDATCNECGYKRDVGGCMGGIDAIFALLSLGVVGVVKAMRKRK